MTSPLRPKKTSARMAPRSSRRSHEEEDEVDVDLNQAPKKSSSGLVLGLSLVGLLVVGGGVGGFFYWKANQKPPAYVATAQEVAAWAEIEKQTKIYSLTQLQAARLRGDIREFVAQYPSQTIKNGDQVTTFENPRLVENNNFESLIAACDEVIVSSMREKEYIAYLTDQERVKAARRTEIEVANAQAAQLAEEERVKKVKAAAEAKYQAELDVRAQELEAGKDEIRKKNLDINMTPDSKYDFDAAKRLWTPYFKFIDRAPVQQWGEKMINISDRAMKTFELFANTGVRYRDRTMHYDGREGAIRRIDITTVTVAVIEQKYGKTDVRELVRPLSDIPPDELWPIVKDADGGKTAEDELTYSFACLLYHFREFQGAKKYLAKVTGIDTSLLAAEVDAVEPHYNTVWLEAYFIDASKLFAEGRRADCMRYIDVSVRPKFTPTKEWQERFQAQFEELYAKAKEINKAQ